MNQSKRFIVPMRGQGTVEAAQDPFHSERARSPGAASGQDQGLPDFPEASRLATRCGRGPAALPPEMAASPERRDGGIPSWRRAGLYRPATVLWPDDSDPVSDDGFSPRAIVRRQRGFSGALESYRAGVGARERG